MCICGFSSPSNGIYHCENRFLVCHFTCCRRDIGVGCECGAFVYRTVWYGHIQCGIYAFRYDNCNENKQSESILWTVPIEIACFVPAVLHVFKITPAWFRYYPANVCMDLVSGRIPPAAGSFIAIGWMAVLFALSKYSVLKMWRSTGGAKL